MRVRFPMAWTVPGGDGEAARGGRRGGEQHGVDHATGGMVRRRVGRWLLVSRIALVAVGIRERDALPVALVGFLNPLLERAAGPGPPRP